MLLRNKKAPTAKESILRIYQYIEILLINLKNVKPQTERKYVYDKSPATRIYKLLQFNNERQTMQ
jgi:hypothetical protein